MILPKFIVRRSHGRQYIPDLDAVCLTEKFRGRPELTEPSDDEQRAALARAAAICPTQAIAAAPFTLDLGRCLFCGEGSRIAPRAIRFTNDYRIGSPTREGLRLAPGMDRVPFDPAAVREQIVTTFGRALKLRQVSAGGDASVEMELNATGNVNFDFGRYGVEFTASPRHADGVVLTGPVTASARHLLRRRGRAQVTDRLRFGSLFGRPLRRKPRRRPLVLRAAARRSVAARRSDPPDDLHRRHTHPAPQKTTLT